MADKNEEAMRFDPKQATANTGTPRKTITWAKAFMGYILNASLQRAVAAAMLTGLRKGAFTEEERKSWAIAFRDRHRYGRRRGWNVPHQGQREIARRHRQIMQGRLTPVFRGHPQPRERDAA